MAIINFTVEFALYGNQADTDDAGVDADQIALVGTVTFEPVLLSENPLLAPGYTTPAGFKILPITGYIDSDGVLYAYRGGPEGVRLWANDPVFRLPSLSYRVRFDVTTPLGEPVKVNGGYFVAPSDDRTINLVDVLQPASSVGGPRISGGSFDGSTVIFRNEDGSYLEAIEVPSGTTVFVDNGDGTWSVGP